MKTKITDEWRTPQWLFNELNNEFNFQLDLCGHSWNSKCDCWCDSLLEENTKMLGTLAFKEPWSMFMNPPYSNPYPFVEKALDLAQYRRVVGLLKVDTSTKWWALFWDYEKHKPKPGVDVRFLPKRVKFDPPQGWEGKVTTPAFPSCIVIMDRRNIKDE